MIALGIEFIAGRFHATPWDRAVNEGDVEWPPSHWRILRAITSGWHAAGAPDTGDFERLISALAEAPRFLLPPSTAAHSRHYMPQGTGKLLEPDRSLVLDAFRAFSDRTTTAFVVWEQVHLAESTRVLLERCCAFVTYLGRAESWCQVSVSESLGSAAHDSDLIPVDLESRCEGAGPVVRRLGVDPTVRGRGLVRALSIDTAAMRKSRRLVPNGSAWLEYRLPPSYGRPITSIVDNLRTRAFDNRCERFIIEGPGRDRQLRPSVKDTIIVADAFRRAAMALEGASNDGLIDPVLSGKALDGRPAVGHKHGYFLPRDLDEDGFIDHVDVWLPGSVGHAAYRALVSVRRLYGWPLEQYGTIPRGEHYTIVHLGEATRERARRWRSATPFVLPRFEKLRGNAETPRLLDDPEQQLLRALGHHGFAEGRLVEVARGRQAHIEHASGRRTLAAFFRTTRTGKEEHREALTAVIEFPDERSGPIALGKHAHFGLGQFVADCRAQRSVAV